MTETATSHLRGSFAYFLDLLEPTWNPTGCSIGELDIRPFAVRHMRPEYETVDDLVAVVAVVADGD